MGAAVVTGLSRWIAATAIGIALAFVLGRAQALDPVAALIIGGCVVVVPLLIARRDPPRGAWLAMVLIAAVPMVAWLGTVGRSQPLVGFGGCGLGLGVLWIIVMPGAQALSAIVGSGLWRARGLLAGVVHPVRWSLIVVGFGVLCVGTVRTATLGPAPTREALVDTRAASTMSRPADGTSTVAVLEGVHIEARCEESLCELSMVTEAGSGPSAVVFESANMRWPDEWVLSVRRVAGPWRIIQLPHPPRGRSYADSIVVHDANAGVQALDVEGLAPWFGPSWGSLLLLAIGLLGVVVTFNVHAREADVWQRLGAHPTAAEVDARPNTIAMRAMHIAVLLMAAVPLMAEASIGLLG